MENEELYQKLQSQERQIEELKRQLYQSSLPLDVAGYYLKKYKEMYEEIRSNRIIELGEELDNIDQEIASLQNDEESLEAMMIANQAIHEKINEIDREIASLYSEIDTKNFEQEVKCNAATEECITLYEKYQEEVNKLDKAIEEFYYQKKTAIELLAEIYAYRTYALDEGFYVVVAMKDKQKAMRAMNNSHEQYLNNVHEQIATLKQVQSVEQDKLQEVSIEQINKLKIDLAESRTVKDNFKDNLLALFDQSYLKHTKLIEDESTRLRLLEYTTKEQALYIEDYLKTFRQELLSLETSKNKAYQRARRLNMLRQEVKSLEVFVEKKSALDSEYRNLQRVFNESRKNIQEVENYIKKIQNTITGNINYKNFVTAYYDYKEKRHALADIIKTKNNTYKELRDMREVAVRDPFSALPLEEIDQKIKEAKADLDQYVRELEVAKHGFEVLSNDATNAKVFMLLKEMAEYEAILPNAYNELEKVKVRVDALHEELLQLTEKAKEYQTLIMQIEVLENESDN